MFIIISVFYNRAHVCPLKAASQDEVSARLAAAAAERAQHQAVLLEKDRELSDTRLVK